MTVKRAFVVMLRQRIHDHVEWPIQLEEFQRLVTAAGFQVLEVIVQTRMKPHAGYLLGRGKVANLAKRVVAEEIAVVAVYNVLTSMQKYKLQQALGVEVLDRYEVVLRVFEREARDRVSQMQLELARLQKSYPFIKVGARERLLRERPTRGEGRGPGEYAYHSQLRQVRKRVAKVTSELARLQRENRRRLETRRQQGVPMVCLVGCYNAGKTSLFNELTGAAKEVSDRPFTTLASKWSRVGNPGMFFVDTIGFALGLDPELISAFQLNLDDMRAADILLLVVDVSDDAKLLLMKLHTTLNILDAAGINRQRILLVLNKMDLLGETPLEHAVSIIEEQYDLEWVAVSALKGMKMEELVTRISKQYETLGPRSSPREDVG